MGVRDPRPHDGPGGRRKQPGENSQRGRSGWVGPGRGGRWGGEARAPDEETEAFVARSATRRVRTSRTQLTASAPRRKRRVLVVEDDAPIRTLIAEVCRLSGHEVLEAADGARAIELASSAQPDLVLVDWVLPDISGTEVILELRRQGLTGPVVMLTARSAKTRSSVWRSAPTTTSRSPSIRGSSPRASTPTFGAPRWLSPLGDAKACSQSAPCRSTTPLVDLQGADCEQAFASPNGLSQRGAPKVGVDARGEDPRIEGLLDVVVGADLQTDDLVLAERAVSMTTGPVSPCLLSSRMTSVPLMSGRTQSTRTRSGWALDASSIARAPSAASSTSWPESLQTSAMRVRIGASSSTTSTRRFRRGADAVSCVREVRTRRVALLATNASVSSSGARASPPHRPPRPGPTHPLRPL